MKAYPQFKWLPIEEQYVPMGGMDLRDYFAVFAMNGLISRNQTEFLLGESLCKAAYEYADAMMKAREQ